MKKTTNSYSQDPSMTRQQIVLRKALFTALRQIAESPKGKLRTGDVIDTIIELAFKELGPDRIEQALDERRKSANIRLEDLKEALSAMTDEDRDALVAAVKPKPKSAIAPRGPEFGSF